MRTTNPPGTGPPQFHARVFMGVCVLVLGLAGVFASPEANAGAPKPIAVGDTLLIEIPGIRLPGVDDVPTVRVGRDGKLRLAVMGAVHAAGLTTEELEAAIKIELFNDGILRDAVVHVTIIARAPKVVR